MKKTVMAAVMMAAALAMADTSEITINLKLDNVDFLVGERVRGVVDVMNVSPEQVLVAGKDFDRVFVEVFRSGDRTQLEQSTSVPFVADFRLEPNEGMKLETFLADHYGLRHTGGYFARPVLVHNGIRYEGQPRSFSVVPGMQMQTATQIFSNHPGLRREFALVIWTRQGREHLFLTASDQGISTRKWNTVDLGQLMKTTKPTISVIPTGEVVVLHRLDPDNFVRSEFWSVPDGIEFNRRELVQDPETAGTNRVRELYNQSGGIQPKENPWWKFW